MEQEGAMIDKELIAMCDTPEIQDRWERREADTWFVQHEDGRLEGPFHVTHFQLWPTETTFRHIYIPCIEDVLRWLKPGDIVAIYPELNGHWLINDNSGKGYIGKPIKALLKAYMHLEHNKNWTGEKWV
jgi:hypothetical protein